MSSRTHSGGHRSSARRGHADHSNRAEMNEESRESSRRHQRTGEQPTPRHEKRHRLSWMHFSGRTEPLVLLTTVRKSHRPASHARPSSRGRESASKRHNFDSPRDANTRSGRTAQDRRLSKSPTNLEACKSQRHGPTSSLLSFFFGNGHAQHVQPVKPLKKVTCISCLADDIPATKAARLSCSHRMCHSCLRRLFTLSITDPQQHMPPRCCTQDHIPKKYVKLLCNQEFQKKWNSKYKEYTTKDRYYCPSRGCGKWIKPSEIIKDHTGKPRYGRCLRCRTKVCCLCRGKWHGDQGECPKDENFQKLEEMAKENGWQRCYNCSSIVELKDGCNHMTCRCKAEFCMKCAKKWKTCDCPWFNHGVADDDAGWDDEWDDEEDEEEEDDFYIRYARPAAVWRQREHLARQYILAHRALQFHGNLRTRE